MNEVMTFVWGVSFSSKEEGWNLYKELAGTYYSRTKWYGDNGQTYYRWIGFIIWLQNSFFVAV